MPVVLRDRGFRLYFYANEGNPLEPPHVHAERGDAEAKVWLQPEVKLAYNDGFSAAALRDVLELVTVNRSRLEQAWHEFFG